MKKKTWLMVGVLCLVAIFGFGMYQSSASQGTPTLSAESIKELVKSQYPGEITSLELMQDKDGAVYEMVIENDGIVYELKVDGESGEIIHLTENIMLTEKLEDDEKAKEKATKKSTEKSEKDKDEKLAKNDKETKVEKKDRQKQEDNNKSKAAPKKEEQKEKQGKSDKKENQKQTGIDMQQAIDIALEHFPGVVEEAELDEEDGRLIYEIEIEAGDEEAEFEIDAHTGEILVVEIDD